LDHGAEHDKWYSPLTGNTFMVPRHPSKEVKTGTANKILKDSGLK
jgi:predicted RNA binding protein YcfA (HicA-like mRNA interferase family)